MAKYLNLPYKTTETQVSICPICHDTKYIVADNCVTLGVPAKQLLTCTECDVCWDFVCVELRKF
jgi:hypothetical protein